jgi:hypothetical protein
VRGPCSICTQTGDLTENHVPPCATGNDGPWDVKSFLASASQGGDSYFPRRYANGVCFRTVCAECNSALGSKEDQVLIRFFAEIRQIANSTIFFGDELKITTKPNLLYRALLAHLCSANDGRPATKFDLNVRAILKCPNLKKSECPNLYYWHYNGPDLTIIRDMLVGDLHSSRTMHIIHVLKLAPLGIMITQDEYPLQNLRRYVQPYDDSDAIVTFPLRPADTHPHWPAVAEGWRVLLSGDSMQLHATRPKSWSARRSSVR